MLIPGDGSLLWRNEGRFLGCVRRRDNYINKRTSRKIKSDCGTTGDISKWKSNQCDMWFIRPPMLLPFILQESISQNANLTAFHCVVSLVFQFPLTHWCTLQLWSYLCAQKIRFKWDFAARAASPLLTSPGMLLISPLIIFWWSCLMLKGSTVKGRFPVSMANMLTPLHTQTEQRQHLH